jgi:hypothetical protein
MTWLSPAGGVRRRNHGDDGRRLLGGVPVVGRLARHESETANPLTSSAATLPSRRTRYARTYRRGSPPRLGGHDTAHPWLTGLRDRLPTAGVQHVRVSITGIFGTGSDEDGAIRAEPAAAIGLTGRCARLTTR